MKFEDHCEESIKLFGEAFEEVHLWLDEFYGTEKYKTRHRRVRHHLAGIEEIRKMFGDRAAEAARQHIISDLKLDGWTDKDRFPVNEADFVSMHFW